MVTLSLKHDFSNDIQDYFKNGLNESATSIKLISTTQTLFCNKLLLQMASPVLRTLIENGAVSFFPDFDSKILYCFIKIVVNGKAFLNNESEKNELLQLTEILQIQNFYLTMMNLLQKSLMSLSMPLLLKLKVSTLVNIVKIFFSPE